MRRNAYTADSLAAAIGIDASTVRRWLSGKRPSPLYALALAAAASDELERQRRRELRAGERARKRSVLEPPKDADVVIEPIRFSRVERQAVGEAASAAGDAARTYIKRRASTGSRSRRRASWLN